MMTRKAKVIEDGRGETIIDRDGREVVLHPPSDQRAPLLRRGSREAERFLTEWEQQASEAASTTSTADADDVSGAPD